MDGPETSTARAWLIGWFGGAILGTVNGVLRERYLVRSMDEGRAHRVSTFSLLAALCTYMWLLQRRRPLPSANSAAWIGGTGGVLTVVFECGLGRLRKDP